MEDNYDIYEDLDSFAVETEKENKIIQDLNSQIHDLQAKVSEKEAEKCDVANKNLILLENISSLLLTAKAELKRKDSLIADIRREKDSVTFRRFGARPGRKCDKYTQTVSPSLQHRGNQTDPIPTHYDNKKNEERAVRSRSKENYISRGKPRIFKERFRYHSRPPSCKRRTDERGRHRILRERSWERERERRIRRGPHTPEHDSPQKLVSFRPVRKVDQASMPDSASDVEISRAFIPMNGAELDRYVKEIGGRDGSPLSDIRQKKAVHKPLEVSTSELWDSKIKKGKESRMSKKEEQPVIHKTHKAMEVIQSDEIGTSGSAIVVSPPCNEDLEMKLSALHGETFANDYIKVPQPPALVIPPPAQLPIIEQVPEIPTDDDVRLNDSRELKIVESDEGILGKDNETHNVVSDVLPMEGNLIDDLEEGEVVSPAASPEPIRHRTKKKSSSKPGSPKSKSHKKPEKSRSDRKHKHRHSSHKHAEQKEVSKTSRRTASRAIEKETRRRTIQNDEKVRPSKKSYRLSSSSSRILDSKKPSSEKKPKRKSEKVSKYDKKERVRKQSETFKELFGTDDDNSISQNSIKNTKCVVAAKIEQEWQLDNDAEVVVNTINLRHKSTLAVSESSISLSTDCEDFTRTSAENTIHLQHKKRKYSSTEQDNMDSKRQKISETESVQSAVIPNLEEHVQKHKGSTSKLTGKVSPVKPNDANSVYIDKDVSTIPQVENPITCVENSNDRSQFSEIDGAVEASSLYLVQDTATVKSDIPLSLHNPMPEMQALVVEEEKTITSAIADSETLLLLEEQQLATNATIQDDANHIEVTNSTATVEHDIDGETQVSKNDMTIDAGVPQIKGCLDNTETDIILQQVPYGALSEMEEATETVADNPVVVTPSQQENVHLVDNDFENQWCSKATIQDTAVQQPADEYSPQKNSSLNDSTQTVIVVSNKFSEYRIEVNNEEETTVYLTRKKKKKKKSKAG